MFVDVVCNKLVMRREMLPSPSRRVAKAIGYPEQAGGHSERQAGKHPEGKVADATAVSHPQGAGR